MNFRPALLALGLLFAGSAFAEETTPPPNPEEAANLQSFAAANPQCKEWSDGCAVCLRETGVKCSTPGIACLPEPIVCKAP